MKRRINIDKTLLILLTAGLVARLVVAIPVFTDISRTAACYDAVSFDLLARHMLESKGFSVSYEAPYKPNSTITPGYPLFVAGIYALTSRSKLAVVFVQIIINLVLLAILYRFLKKRFENRPALWMGILFIADINTALFVTQMTTETLFTFLLVCFLILLLECFEKDKFTLAICSGLLLGAATLVRPIVLYFTVPLLLFVFFTGFRWRKLLQWGIILGIQLVFITPWVIRNRVVFGECFYTTISDVNLLRYHAAPLKAGLEGMSRDEAQAQLELEGTGERTDFDEAGYYRSYGRAARRYLLSHPLPYIGSLVMGGLATMLYPLPMAETGFYFREPENLPASGVAQSVLIDLMKGRVVSALRVVWKERLVYYGIPVFLMFLVYSIFHLFKLGFGLRAYILRGLRDPFMLLFLLTGIYFMGLLGFGISARMRVPIEPLLVSLAGIGIFAKRIKGPKDQKRKVKKAGGKE